MKLYAPHDCSEGLSSREPKFDRISKIKAAQLGFTGDEYKYSI